MDIQVCMNQKVGEKVQLRPIFIYKSDHVPMTGERISFVGYMQGKYRVTAREVLLNLQKSEGLRYDATPKVKDETITLVVEKVD